MNIIVALYSAVLFFLLSPNIVLRLPSNGSKMTVAMIHAAIFGIVLYFTQKMVWQFSTKMLEGVENMAKKTNLKPPSHRP